MIPKGTGPWSRIARELKRRFLRRMLYRFAGNKAVVARHLGISREHLDTLLRQHDLLGPLVRRTIPRPHREWFGVQVSP